MKKACIFFAVAGSIFTIAGIIIIGIFTSMGYTSEGIHFDVPFDIQSIENYAETTYIQYEEGIEDNGNAEDYSNVYSSEEATELSELEISISAADFHLRSGDTFSVSATDINPDDLSEEYSDGKYTLSYSSHEIDFWDLMNEKKSPSITVTVPAKTYDEVTFSMSAGMADFTSIYTEDFEFLMTAGEAYLTDIISKEETELKICAGTFDISDSVLTNTDIEKTAGYTAIRGNSVLDGKTDINVTAGELSIKVIDSINSYRFDVSKTAGDVYINGNETTPDTSGDKNVKISITAGDIRFDTTEN